MMLIRYMLGPASWVRFAKSSDGKPLLMQSVDGSKHDLLLPCPSRQYFCKISDGFGPDNDCKAF